MHILDFLAEHDISELALPPYNLKMDWKDDYVLLSYKYDSDPFEPIVREARGLILYREDNGSFTPVCVPFYRFFNDTSELNTAVIDWSTAQVQEKVDGSLIKMWYHNGWHISTTGKVDAKDAPASFEDKTFYDLVMEQIEVSLFDVMNRDYTYMFEFVHPFTQVAIYYAQPALYFLGARNNITLEETHYIPLYFHEFGIKIPKRYPLTSYEEVKEAAAALGVSQEGYVVCDANFNRIKVKSPEYLTIHYISVNKTLNAEIVLELFRANALDDFTASRPIAIDFVNKTMAKYYKVQEKMNALVAEIGKFSNRKDLAAWALTTPFSAFIFFYLDGKIKDAEEYLNNAPISFILSLISKEEA